MFEICDGLFEFVMNRERAREGAHTGRAGAEFIHSFFCGFIDARMTDQSQVTVGSVHAHLSSTHEHLCSAAHFFHRLVVKIQVVSLKIMNAIRHCFDTTGHSIVCSMKIHDEASKKGCCKFSR